MRLSLTLVSVPVFSEKHYEPSDISLLSSFVSGRSPDITLSSVSCETSGAPSDISGLTSETGEAETSEPESVSVFN